MAQQMYGRNREEPYAPSYGFVPKAAQVVETKQSSKKPVVINYYPSGNTNNPQRVIAQVETVTREVARNPGTVIEPVKEIRSHGDSQLRREDEFVNKLRDDLNDASRNIQPSHIQPKVLSTNLDQVQLGDPPRDRHGHGAMSDGWSDPHDSADPSHPRKVAELVNRVSNWRGANGYDRGKPTSDGYDSTYDNSRYTGSRNNNRYGGDSTNRISPSSKISGGYGSSDEFGYGNRGRPADEGYNRTYGVNPQTPPSAGSGYSYITGTSKPLSTQQGYDQYGYNEPRVDYHGGFEGSNGYGNRGRPTDDDYTRRNGVSPHAPRAGDSYSYTIGSTNRPVSKQEGYDQYGYSEPRVGYHGGGEGSIVRPVASNQSGYGYGVDTGNGYSSGLPRSSYVERPVGATSDTVITSVEAVTKYRGTFVPMMKTRREEEAKVLVKI